MAEIKSIPDHKCISPKQLNIMVSSKNTGFGYPLTIQIPRLKQPVPLLVLFRALGVTSDKEICEYILLDLKHDDQQDMLEFINASIRDAADLLTQEDCLSCVTQHVMYTPINMDRETGQKSPWYRLFKPLDADFEIKDNYYTGRESHQNFVGKNGGQFPTYHHDYSDHTN